MPIVNRFIEFDKAVKDETSAPDKYRESAIGILQQLREGGSMTDQQIELAVRGTAIRVKTLKSLLKTFRLATRARGRNGRWRLAET